MTTEDVLPELPESDWHPRAFDRAFSADQMHTYALAALALVQAERDAMQQERDELRAALEWIADRRFHDANEAVDFARAVLTPKATQQETRA